MSYDLEKLRRSLHQRVKERLRELLPEAEIHTLDSSTLTLKHGEIDGLVTLDAMVEECHHESRDAWGPIAGEFCQLVASRVELAATPALSDPAELDRLVPSVLPIFPETDRMVAEGTPDDGLLVAWRPWMDGIRVEFDYRGEDMGRRLFVRDVLAMGVTMGEVEEKAKANMARLVPVLNVTRLGTSGVDSQIFVVKAEGNGPAMLWADSGHKAMFMTLSKARQATNKVLATAPRSDLLLFCSMKNKAAASHMVSYAWEIFESDDADGVPFSPRLFSIAGPGNLNFVDVGLSADKLAEWTVTDMGAAVIRHPTSWSSLDQEGKWLIWPGGDGARVRVTFVDKGAGSVASAVQLAQRVREKHESEAETGYGFFNGLPWAWVDTGIHQGHATASMFIVLPAGMAILQTEVPDGTSPEDAAVLQKVVATFAPKTS